MSRFLRDAHNVLQERRFLDEQRIQKILNALLDDDKYSELNAEKVDLRANISRLASQNQDCSALNERYYEIVDKMQQRMQSLGYSQDDLKRKPVCTICNDTGFVNGEECNCLKQIVYARLRAHCGALATEESDLDKVDLSIIPQKNRESYDNFYAILKLIAEKFPLNKKKILGVFGAVGVGKSYGLSVLANNLMERGFSVLVLNSAEMNSIFLKMHLAREADKQDIWEPLIECDLLVIDDLGAEPNINNVTANYLYCLINERDQKTTAFTSNLPEDYLRSKYGDRVFSRLCHKQKSILMTLEGKDLRLN
ncbi:MAG: ATP-binding protein [Clostridia bacterium]|nr:ATP-binding protein [Clostridia bacterium]